MGRHNWAISLLEQDQPVYLLGSHQGAFSLSHAEGQRMAHTWADLLNVDLEHAAFDPVGLHAFMRGLAAEAARLGCPMPSVLVECPLDGGSEHAVRANAWQLRQVLAAGVHGILLCHAEAPAAARAFVESCRFPFSAPAQGLEAGRRGSGGQRYAAAVWGCSQDEYLRLADPWPLNPQGELLLGIKVENRRALEHTEASTAIPGLAFAEWGPGDMGMSFGYPDRHDPPYPPEMLRARERVFTACQAAGLRFLNAVTPEDTTAAIDEGVRICAASRGAGEQAARNGRLHTRAPSRLKA